jgi:hypothetical protein
MRRTSPACSTSEIAVVVIATLIIAIGVFFAIRNWRN